MPKLSDNFSIGSISGAGFIFDKLAQDTIHLAALDARVEARIADLKAKHEKETNKLRLDCALAAERLTAFIATNPETFKDPRKVVTNFGSFGLHHVTDLIVKDEEQLVAWLQAKGHPQCLKTTVKPVKTVIKKAIVDGLFSIAPGATLREVDEPVYNVDQSLVAAARKRAIES